MEKEFVPYQESLELKELGFDEPTLYHWHNSCKTHPFTNEVHNPNCRPTTNSGIKDIGEENHVWSAPTFSQAFRWFREKYNLLVSPFQSLDDKTYQVKDYYFEIGKIGNLYVIVSTDNFQTYEEAELACIRKLIEIIKNKN